MGLPAQNRGKLGGDVVPRPHPKPELRFAMTRLYSSFLQRALCIVFALLCIAGMAVPAWAQFETRATRGLPNESFGVVAGDFNRDGKLDVAVIGDYLSVLLGNGDGTFQAPVNYTAISQSIAIGDFNGDGNLDLVIGNESNSVSVFLGNGDGTFQPPRSSETTSSCCSFIAGADLNGDHKMDIVVIDFPDISILLGNGDGTFQAPIDIQNDSLVGAHEMTVGDFNNDGRPDVALVGYWGGSQNLWILLSNGDGTFQSPLIYPLNYTPGSVAAADFNRDGKLDLAIGGYIGGGVAVLLGNGDGSFQPEVDYTTGEGLVLVRDFNQDGNLDIVAGLSELLGNGDGTFRLAGAYPMPSGTSTSGGLEATGDFNGDGLPDLVSLDNQTDVITTMLNTGPLDFLPTTPLRFQVQLIHTDIPGTIVVTNTGAKTISISSIRVSGQFKLGRDTTCEASIGAGESCAISVIFQPQTAGSQGGLVMIKDGASSKLQVIEVSGRGTDLDISPASLHFTDQAVGTQSQPKQLFVTNVSSEPVAFSEIGIGGTAYLDYSQTNTCGPQLAGGASCTMMVTFAPTRRGTRNGDAFFTVTQAEASPEFVTLAGRGY